MIGAPIPVFISLAVALFFWGCTDLAIVASVTTDTDSTLEDSNMNPRDTEPIVDGLPDGVGWYSASYLGGVSGQATVGSAIQLNGNIVLAANVGELNVGELNVGELNVGELSLDAPETILSTATAASSGVVVILDGTGRRVISATRVAEVVTDMALDPRDDTLYVACGSDGLVKLPSDAQRILWRKTTASPAQRVDVGPNGAVILLSGTAGTIPFERGYEAATLQLFDDAGTSMGSRLGYGLSADVCIDDSTGTAVLIGWRETAEANVPTQIPYLHGYALDTEMALKWQGYDWDETTDNFGDSTAAVQGALCEVGVGGELTAVFTVFGGNHVLRYDPLQIDLPVGDKNVSSDDYHLLYNSHSEPKTVVGKYSSSTGELTVQTQFCARDASNAAVATKPYAVFLDAIGNVYLGGYSEELLPLDDATGFDPFSLIEKEESYAGGGWLLTMTSDLIQRTFCTRVGREATTYTVAARRIYTGETLVAMAGGQPAAVENGIAEVYPIQGEKQSADTTGWFAVLRLIDH